MRNRHHASPRAHARKQGTVADASCAENNVLPVRQIVRCVHAVEFLFVPIGD